MNPFTSFWHTCPVFRILLFYVFGLLLSDFICQELATKVIGEYELLWGYAGFLVVNLVALILKYRPKCNFCFGKPYHGGLICSFFCVLGLFLNTYCWWRVSRSWPEQNGCYQAILINEPQYTEKTVRSEAVLFAFSDSVQTSRLTRRVQLTFQRSKASEALKPGDTVCFWGMIGPPSVNGNPGAFDYARYLLRKGVEGTTFLREYSWSTMANLKTDHQNLSVFDRLRIMFLVFRKQLVEHLSDDGLSKEGHALFSALALGDKSELTDEISDIYQRSGTSHILALSGMHLSVLMSLFYFFFLQKFRYRKERWLLALPVILLIWSYTFLAGLPMSLVRAAWMSSLAVIGMLCQRRNFTLNVLFLAAFVMLLLDPFALYDVGLQLSFVAVAAIVLLQKRIMTLVHTSVGWKKTLWQMLSVSFAAQIGTIPLVAYYFHTISMVSSLATLCVSPITAILLYLFPVYLLMGWWNPFHSVLMPFIDFLVYCQNQVLAWFAALPMASLSGIYLSLPGVIACYVLLYVCFTYRNTYRFYRFVTLLACIFLLFYDYMDQYGSRKVTPQLIFYNNPSAPAVHFIHSARCSYLYSASSVRTPEEQLKSMNYIRETFWQSTLENPPQVIDTHYSDSLLYCRDGFLLSDAFSVLVLNDASWTVVRNMPDRMYPVDYLYVCRGYSGELAALECVFKPKLVVLDNSLTAYQRKNFQETCRNLGWSCYDMRAEGALKVALK